MPALSTPFRLTEGNSVFLDLLRGVSAQAVVIGHALFFYGFTDLETSPDFFVMQGYAVLVFFILSGFLITYSTVNKLRRGDAYGFGHFFIDRFSRIYTGFVPALLFVLVVDSISRYWYPDAYPYAAAFNLKTFVGNLLMLQDIPGANYLFGGRMTSFGSGRPFWSLAIEWWIYLFFGWAVLRLLPRRGNRRINLLVFAPLLIVPSFNLWGGHGNGLMATWLLGALAYLVIANGYLHDLSRRHLLLLSAWLTALGVIRFLKTGEEYDPILAFLSTTVILLLIKCLEHFSWPKTLTWLIRKNAAFSFTLYLVHYAVLDILRSAYGTSVSPAMLLVGGFVLSNLCAMAIGLYTEVSLTARVKRWLYQRFL